MLKRTLLDMEGVFSASEKWVKKASMQEDAADQADSATTQLFQQAASKHSSSTRLDLSKMSKEMDLKPEEIEQIVSGKAPSRLSSKTLSDTVLFGLSDDDRALLERINGVGM